jgi:hypothetical protein
MYRSDLFENLSVNSLKGDLSNATTFNRPRFSFVNTFKGSSTKSYMKKDLSFERKCANLESMKIYKAQYDCLLDFSLDFSVSLL